MSRITRRGLALRLAALAGVATFSLGATPNWTTTVAVTDGGHLLGNPDAKLKLIAFISYTCPHCEEFEKQSDAPLRLEYIQTGKVSLEIRHFVRDPVDLTAAMIANCAPPSRFFDIHKTFFWTQEKWAPLMASASKAQADRWRQPGIAGRRAIATDFGFYALVEGKGMGRTQVDACLANDALAKRLADGTAADSKKYGVDSTPNFVLNGTLLAATYQWNILRFQLDARL